MLPLPGFIRNRFSAVEMVIIGCVARIPVHTLRIWTLRRLGATISDTAVVYHGFQIRAARNLSVGNNTSIGDGAILDARGGLVIGANVNMSTGVNIWTAQHDWKSPDFDYVESGVVVEDHVWIGPRATILPGATIRRGAVVAAGAVVKGEVAAFTLVGGVPAKPIASRPRTLRYTVADPKTKTWWW